jgi:cell division protein FtsB
MIEQDKLRLQEELQVAVARINQLEQERNDLRAENNALRRKMCEMLKEASIQEARNAMTPNNK